MSPNASDEVKVLQLTIHGVLVGYLTGFHVNAGLKLTHFQAISSV